MTVDRYGILDGKKTLVDIKTSSSIQKVLHGAQLKLYRMGLVANGFDVERAVILRLTKEGEHKIIESEQDDEVAIACVTLHNALKKKPRKKKGE